MLRAKSSVRTKKNQQTENGQTTEPQLVSAIRSKRVSARAARLGLLDLLATTGPCLVPIGQCAEPRLAVSLRHIADLSYPDRRPFVLVHYVSLRMRAPGGSIERFDNITAQLRVVITTRRLSVASFAIDHPSLGRNNNNNGIQD